MKKPLIGINCHLRNEGKENFYRLNQLYVKAIESAGGIPLILPFFETATTARNYVDRIDGLILTGGDDPNPKRWKEKPHPKMEAIVPEKEESDFHLARNALRKDKPILGICYGMQLINAVHGGTLYGDVERDCGVKPHHPRRSHAKSIQHNVSLEPDTHLSASIASADPVNSFHVQAVAELGDDLVLTLRSEDGLVEGFESTDGRTTGVQFHPERQPGTVWDHLFTDLVAKARR